MQSNCKPGQLKWVYSCLVSGSWMKQPMNSAQHSCCFSVGEAAPQASFPAGISLRLELGNSWNNLCFQSTKHRDPLRPSVSLSMLRLIFGEVLLAYKSNPTQREWPHWVDTNSDTVSVSALHRAAGAGAGLCTPLPGWLQCHDTSWSICILLRVHSKSAGSLTVRENKPGRNTPAHIVFQMSLCRAVFASQG